MDLYREAILDYYKHPRNKGKLDDADIVVTETNASCGDEIVLYLKLKEGRVEKVQFEGVGCAISQVATSMLCEALPELSSAEIQELTLESIYEMLGGPVNAGRVKCAALGLRALERGMKKRLETSG